MIYCQYSFALTYALKITYVKSLFHFHNHLTPTKIIKKIITTSKTQSVQRIFSKIAKPLKETFTGLRCMLQGFTIYFARNLILRA